MTPPTVPPTIEQAQAAALKPTSVADFMNMKEPNIRLDQNQTH